MEWEGLASTAGGVIDRRPPPPERPPGPAVPYIVTFYERDRPERQLRALLGDTPPTPIASGGDWETVPLPKRSAVILWRGRLNLMTMSIPIVLGGLGTPVNAEHTALIKAWRPENETTEPPVIKVVAQGDAVPYQHLSWVLDGMPEWGDAVAGAGAKRLLQKMTVNLHEHRVDEKLQAARVHNPAPRRTRRHTVKQGETLITIARKLKVKGGWQALGAAQHPPIRDPRKVRPGEKLTIPE